MHATEMPSSSKKKLYHSSSNTDCNLQPATCNLRLGILGSGQLGQMMAAAAKKLGCRVLVYDAVANGPAAAVADEMIVASFDDKKALQHFASRVDVITLEFENIPAAALDYLASQRPVYPNSQVVRCCQDRVLEKEFLQAHGFPLAPFYAVTSLEELTDAVNKLKSAAILKTATLGYDGKGQVSINVGDDLSKAWHLLKTSHAVLEKKISFVAEGSVIVARSTQGELRAFPPQENQHRNGILDISIAPARLTKKIQEAAEEMACRIAEALQVVGLLTIEFFVLADGSLIVNELAPRPHNSGHHTMESSDTSQFEQAIRAVGGLPLGSTQLKIPTVMVNLLGDLWAAGEPDWTPLLNDPNSALHLYGKKEAKPGRKMGHVTFTGSDQKKLLALAKSTPFMVTKKIQKK